jgi:hypothetical protein
MTTNESVLTDNTNPKDEEKKDRSIQQLLKLNTYQGMSDSEITSIVNYAVQQAATQAAEKVNQTAIQKGYDSLLTQAQNATDKLKESIDTANNTATNFRSVNYEQTT